MSADFVVDCSLTMAWCFADETTPATYAIQERLVTETALVPSLWFLEVANVLAIAERRKRLTPEKSARFITLLHALNIEIDDEAPRRAFADLLPLCRAHALTSYDAAYLELAMRRALPIASLDTGLRKSAKRVGVTILR